MVRINITAEGQTEEAFITQILVPYLLSKGKLVQTRRLRTSKTQRGGYTTYGKARYDVVQWLRSEPHAWHTTMVDLYGLHHDFPGYTDACSIHNPAAKVQHIQRAWLADLATTETAAHKFIPYVQLHEFEALLFADAAVMEEWLGLNRELPAGCFTQIVQLYPNPEWINDSPLTAPSKRIERLCTGYDKVGEGLFVVQEIGLEQMRVSCPLFGAWLTMLESLT